MRKHKKSYSLFGGRYIAGDEPEKIVEDEDVDSDEEDEEEQPKVIFINDNKNTQKDPRIVGLYGSVDEVKACNVIEALMYLKEFGKEEVSEEECCDKCGDIKFVLSTYGGNSAEAFAIYDTMKDIQKECDIATVGLGKVMSAGVMLLAAGTKGKRYVGQNCRLMIHSVFAGSEGILASLDNEILEIKFLQEQYIDCLVRDTKMTKKLLTKLVNKGTNHYFDANQAIAWGIADHIL